MWIDTHAHLDAGEFSADLDDVVLRSRAAGVEHVVVPAVGVENLERVRALAHAHELAYSLGVHPLFAGTQPVDAVDRLQQSIERNLEDCRLVALGEIGLDLFTPDLDRQRQEYLYAEQLKLARRYALPVLLHSRRAVDAVLKQLRRIEVPGGIAHAFNGSEQQARFFIERGFKLGFGGALTFERALHIRRLAQRLPLDSLVMETDAPDIPPHWLYKTAEQRAAGETRRNEPAELPRIAQELATLRGMPLEELARHTSENARAVLPRLRALH
ncbi:TatD family hydrolase [Schlegelella sp. S2-27]|uniref:TatD family hydrolase n=1 Tax=Caldimonas mangrovi TaxID=2944811 RepID=A0ABT0YGW4_9BURK|nr:TatD family hydrolase [Caldimonas mangrovi]MCM5677976.1 TatD family hydrolase [Caldimonas mangrovi]